VAAKSKKVFVNPNFSSGQGDPKKKKTIYVDPELIQLKKRQGQHAQLQEQNSRLVASAAVGSNTPSPGSEKENEPLAVIAGSVFKKIGTKKLVRVRANQSPSALTSKAKKGTPPTYKTPPRGRRNFFVQRLVTPLSLRRRRHRPSPTSAGSLRGKHVTRSNRLSLYQRMLNPFKIDRRKAKNARMQPTSNHSCSPTVGAPYTNKTPKSCPPPKPIRASLIGSASMTPVAVKNEPLTVNIQGVRYKMSANGMTLNRLDPNAPPPTFTTPVAVPIASSSQQSERSNPVRASIIAKKIFLEGKKHD